MEPETKKWLVIGLIVALAIVAVVVITAIISDDNVPAGGVVGGGCEPCTEGCACDSPNVAENQGTP